MAAAITKDADTLEVAINGTLLSGSALDAERANTLCWIDGECLSYTTATMLQNGNYELSGLVRGQYNTAAAAHGQGAKFARCDETLLKTPLKKEDIGKKLWLKFTSYNIFGAQEQSLADVDAYEYTVTAYYIPPVLNLSAHNRYRELQDGVSRYDIVVDWEAPTFANYLEGNVWYKTSSGQGDALTFEEGVEGDRQGYNGPWIFGGSGKNQVVIPQAIVGDTYLLACTTKDQYGESNSPDLSPQTELLVALKTTTPNTPDGFGITFGNAAILSWEEVTNADVLFYEVRYNQEPGVEDSNLLVRTNGTSATVTLKDRKGTLYLYAKSAIGKYSAPAVLEYNKALPPKPAQLSATPRLGGISIIVSSIPSGCNGVNFYIDDTILIQSANTTITHSCEAGIHSVTAAYTDIFGEGPKCDSILCTVKLKVDNELIEKESITIDRMTPAAMDAISNASVDKINIAVKGILGEGSALVMQNGEYALVTSNGETLTGIFANSDGVIRLDGKYIHITGETLFEDNIITNKMLQAGSVSAEKLAAEEIALGGALKIVGGGVTLSGEGLKVANSNGSYTLFNTEGMNFFDSLGEKFAGIGRLVIGTASHGQYIRFTNPWDVDPKIILIPVKMQITAEGYTAANLFWTIYAGDISKNGFKINAYSTLGAGSSGLVVKKTPILSKEWYSGTVEGSAVITPLANATKAEFTISIGMAGYFSQTESPNEFPLPPTIIQYYAFVKEPEIHIYQNNVEIGSYIDTTGYQYSATQTEKVIACEITPNVEVTITAKAKSGDRHNYGGNISASFVVQQIAYNVDVDTIISTGDVTFIATDGNTSAFTIE